MTVAESAARVTALENQSQKRKRDISRQYLDGLGQNLNEERS